MATGQVLFHRFYCKKSFARFDVKVNLFYSFLWLLINCQMGGREGLVLFIYAVCFFEGLVVLHLVVVGGWVCLVLLPNFFKILGIMVFFYPSDWSGSRWKIYPLLTFLISLQIVAASALWLATKLEESPRRARQVIIVFHRMECRRENLPLEHLDLYSKVRFDKF